MTNITEITEKNTTVTGAAGQQKAKPCTGNGVWNPYSKQWIQLPSATNHFQLASTHLRNLQASETSRSTSHDAWLKQQQHQFHVSNSNEELDAELLKLSVPEPTTEKDPKADKLQEAELKEPEQQEPEAEPAKEKEETVLQIQAPAKATAETKQSTLDTPSEAVLNFQKSLTLLTEEEKQQVYAQVITPSTGRRTPATGLVTRPTAKNYFAPQQQVYPTPFLHQYQPVQQYTPAPYTFSTDQTYDPLLAVMSKPRLSVFQDFIKELATASIVATDVLENKMSATKKLQDPTNENHVPRSIRNKNFTLTTIAEFQDHPKFNELQMKATNICAQYKANLAETVRELATNEIMWLKILRVQKILQPLQKIIASLVYRVEHTMARPTFPPIVQNNTIYFFVFYWMIQLNSHLAEESQATKSYVEFLDLPAIDILATAATILIKNSPQTVATVIENLNTPELNWDLSDVHQGYYVNTLLADLQEIFQAAIIDNISYQQTKKASKITEAQTLAFINKLRTKTATELTNETLNRVVNQSHTETITEKDLKRRQQELEDSLKQTKELLQTVAKRSEYQDIKQKNLPGSSSAQRPSQLKPNEKYPQAKRANGHPSWTPPAPKTIMQPEAKKKPPTQTITAGAKTITNEADAKQPAKTSNKKRKFHHKRGN